MIVVIEVDIICASMIFDDAALVFRQSFCHTFDFIVLSLMRFLYGVITKLNSFSLIHYFVFLSGTPERLGGGAGEGKLFNTYGGRSG